MSNLNLKGLWIPIEVLTDKNLSDKEKQIYSLIVFLSQEKQYCFCTNKTISELLNISVTQVSKLVNSLKDKGYIKQDILEDRLAEEILDGNLKKDKLTKIGVDKDRIVVK